jgi:hypothetical protein
MTDGNVGRLGRRIIAAIALAAAAVLGALGVLGADVDRSRAQDLGTGSAWFATVNGRAALLDGTSDTVVVHRTVADRDDRFEVLASGADALVINHTKGSLRRVDGATWEVREPVPLLIAAPGDERVSVRAGRSVTWLVATTPALAQLTDPHTLASIGEPVSLPADVTDRNIKVTTDGTLWALGPTGDLRSYRDGRPATGVALDDVRDGRLVLAGDRPAVVDPAHEVVHVIDGASGEPSARYAVEGIAEDGLVVAGSGPSSSLVLAVTGTGVLRALDVGDGRVTIIRVGDQPGRQAYGEPVEKGGLVFVPRLGLGGQVIVADPAATATGRIRARIPLEMQAFRLTVHGGRVWYDEEAGDRAGVITDRLEALTVTKSAGGDRADVASTSTTAGSEPPDTTDEPVPPVPPSSTPAPPSSRGSQDRGAPPRLVQLDVPARAVAGEPVTVHDRTSIPHTVDRWEIAGAVPANPRGDAPAVTFPAPGRYNVVLVVRWSDGTGGAGQRAIEVVPPPPPTGTTTTTTPTNAPPPPPPTNPTTTAAPTTTTTRPQPPPPPPPPPPTTTTTVPVPPPPPPPPQDPVVTAHGDDAPHDLFDAPGAGGAKYANVIGAGQQVTVRCRKFSNGALAGNPGGYWYQIVGGPYDGKWGATTNYQPWPSGNFDPNVAVCPQ